MAMQNPNQRRPIGCLDIAALQSMFPTLCNPKSAIRDPKSEIAPISEQSLLISEQSAFISEQSALISVQTALISEQTGVILGFITVEFVGQASCLSAQMALISVIYPPIPRHFAILLRTYRNGGEKNGYGEESGAPCSAIDTRQCSSTED